MKLGAREYIIVNNKNKKNKNEKTNNCIKSLIITKTFYPFLIVFKHYFVICRLQ